jgi:hypothetical protein
MHLRTEVIKEWIGYNELIDHAQVHDTMKQDLKSPYGALINRTLVEHRFPTDWDAVSRQFEAGLFVNPGCARLL